MFVAMVGGDGGGEVHSDKEFTGEQRKSAETITRIEIYLMSTELEKIRLFNQEIELKK